LAACPAKWVLVVAHQSRIEAAGLAALFPSVSSV